MWIYNGLLVWMPFNHRSKTVSNIQNVSLPVFIHEQLKKI